MRPSMRRRCSGRGSRTTGRSSKMAGPVYGCEKVRVEINRNPRPRTEGGADSALG